MTVDWNAFLHIDLPFKMDQEQIKAARAAINEKRTLLQEALEELRLRSKVLQNRCKHPRSFTSGSYDGSTSVVCPDCGMR